MKNLESRIYALELDLELTAIKIKMLITDLEEEDPEANIPAIVALESTCDTIKKFASERLKKFRIEKE